MTDQIPPAQDWRVHKDWHAEAWRLFGYALGCSNNHDAAAKALQEIALALEDGCEVKISVIGVPPSGSIKFELSRAKAITPETPKAPPPGPKAR